MPTIQWLMILVLGLAPIKEIDTFKLVDSVVQVNTCYFMRVYDKYSAKKAVKICDWSKL